MCSSFGTKLIEFCRRLLEPQDVEAWNEWVGLLQQFNLSDRLYETELICSVPKDIATGGSALASAVRRAPPAQRARYACS